jgi:membrane protease YdiL (CAAX protease family)
MTATTPPPPAAGGQPATQPQPGGAVAAGGVGGAVLLVGTRAGLWLGVQLGLADLLLLAGKAASGGQATAPMFAVVDLPSWASVVSVLVVPLLAELAELVAYLGVVLPPLERRLGRAWLAATIVVVVWAAEHALYPLLTDGGGGLDLGFAAYRVGSVLPFLAICTALYYALGGGCCRSWRPGGFSTATPRSPWPWAWSNKEHRCA